MEYTRWLLGTSKNPLIGMQRKAQTGAIRRYCEDLQRRDAPEYGVFRSSLWDS
jgi:hypothetical protein